MANEDHFIQYLRRYHKKHPDLAVVLYIRVSSGPQEDKGNLDTYEWKLRRVCGKRGISVVEVYRETGSGWVLDENRHRLIAAVEHDRRHEAETGVHTAVLAPCTDRFVRNMLYHSRTNPDATPTKAELCMLRNLTGGVPLLTYLNPNMPPRDVTSRRTKWGQQFKGRKGGGDRKPGWRKRRKERLQPEARRLRADGLTYRETKKRLGVSLRTVWKWVNCA
jgi:DNA invertase Pin-like site-specific DNA recombinase